MKIIQFRAQTPNQYDGGVFNGGFPGYIFRVKFTLLQHLPLLTKST